MRNQITSVLIVALMGFWDDFRSVWIIYCTQGGQLFTRLPTSQGKLLTVLRADLYIAQLCRWPLNNKLRTQVCYTRSIKFNSLKQSSILLCRLFYTGLVLNAVILDVERPVSSWPNFIRFTRRDLCKRNSGGGEIIRSVLKGVN